jgi:fructose-1,6-bisphosphatase/inositol monophosphatase family enzyme
MNLPTGEVFTAARGDGVKLDGVPVRARPVTTLRDARVALIRPETDAAWRTLRAIAVGAARIRVTGCSALDLALISCGTLDALINPNRISPRGYGEKIVDYAGALALLNETGSVLTGFDGVRVSVDFDLSRRTPLVAAATPALHAELIEALHAEAWDDVVRDEG